MPYTGNSHSHIFLSSPIAILQSQKLPRWSLGIKENNMPLQIELL